MTEFLEVLTKITNIAIRCTCVIVCYSHFIRAIRLKEKQLIILAGFGLAVTYIVLWQGLLQL